MWTNARQVLLALALSASAASAQEQSGTPLSAIGWLAALPAEGAGPTVFLEPPVSTGITVPDVTVSPLPAQLPPLGLVPPERAGVPSSVFQTSDAKTLKRLLERAPVLENPAMQSLLYTLLLTETLPPPGQEAADILSLARLDKLLELGAASPAQALAKAAGGAHDPELFSRWFDAALLIGDEAQACAVLNRTPALAPEPSARIFCAARGGDWQLAELLRSNGATLGTLSVAENERLDRFLNTEFYEDAPFLVPPTNPDPLDFRLYEAIGERLPTRTLPRVFANADLQDVAGWKAQVEAAERLTRSGAMIGNRLLGFYTERRPAASGGIWDRIRAVQRFDGALASGDDTAIAKALPDVWSAMKDAGTQVAFSSFFAEQLRGRTLPDEEARSILFEILLLSGAADLTLSELPNDTAETRFLFALSHGDPDPNTAPDTQAKAIATGFDDPATLPAALQNLWDLGRTGEVMLRAIGRFDQGSDGNLSALTEALMTLRAVGLEKTARQAALQLRILDRT